MVPQCDIRLQMLGCREKQDTVYMVGESLLDRGSPVAWACRCGVVAAA